MKNTLLLFAIGLALILFWYFTKEHLPLGKIPAIMGAIIIFKGIIDLRK